VARQPLGRVDVEHVGSGIAVVGAARTGAETVELAEASQPDVMLKDTRQDELLRAIRAVAQGGAIFSPGIAQRVRGDLSVLAPAAVSAMFQNKFNSCEA